MTRIPSRKALSIFFIALVFALAGTAEAQLAGAEHRQAAAMLETAKANVGEPVKGVAQFSGGVVRPHARFLKIVDEARKNIRETTVDKVKQRLDRGEKFVLVDVREESEFARDHLPGAIHLSKGVIERDVEERVPDVDTAMVLYCGGGPRSALAADNLRKMGYTNVVSMDGGIRVWREKGYPLAK